MPPVSVSRPPPPTMRSARLLPVMLSLPAPPSMVTVPPTMLTLEKLRMLLLESPSSRNMALPPLPLLVSLMICSMPLLESKLRKPTSTGPLPWARITSVPKVPESA
ncbi:MAG: hypothetical protein EBT27_09515 [Betaproteobacteria bacterium]|nr:hypothetical protein [Betaproteobacteria bacterium]